MRKSVEEMDRSELIGMVRILQRQLEELTSPEHTRLYQLGRLQSQTQRPKPETRESSFWKRFAPGAIAR
jgi:hypothetical protein